jgi:hypothetical protein
MPRPETGDPPDEDFEDEDDFEGGEPDYSPEAGEAGEFSCPKCAALMYADAVRCPECGEYVTPGALPPLRRHAWLWIGLVLLLAAVAAGLVAAVLWG